jgi:hypothetical protein
MQEIEIQDNAIMVTIFTFVEHPLLGSLSLARVSPFHQRKLTIMHALSDVTKEIMFIKNVLESMGAALTFPIKVKVGNVEAIY